MYFQTRLRKLVSGLVLFAGITSSILDGHSLEAARSGQIQELIEVLRSDASVYEKARACQQLGEFGSKAAVPALAALLGDERLSAYARSGLEGIPHPSAAAALRAALGTLKGNQLAGVINSLGMVCDSQSVMLLKPLATNLESGVAKEAVLALGGIGSDEVVPILREILAHGAESIRSEAASANLLAAERQLANGHAEIAREIYDAVRNAEVSPACLAAATRGAILARGSDGPAFLVRQLDSEDGIVRNAALMTIREVPSSALAGLLNSKLKKAGPELQVQLLAALADCHNPQTIRRVEVKTESDDPEVRRAALLVLGQIGGPAEADIFLNALRKNRSAEETAMALGSLERLQGPEVDARVLKALSGEGESANRVRLIRLVSSRSMSNATAELLKQAGARDNKVCLAALKALGVVAGSQDLPALIAFTRSCPDDSVRRSAAGAMVRLCRKSGNLEAEEVMLMAEFERTADPQLRSCWLSIMAELGCPTALPVLRAGLRGTSDQAAIQAIALLASWPDPTPVEDLLTVVELNPNAAPRTTAFEAAVRLAITAADGKVRPDDVILAWLRRADKLAQNPKECWMVLSGLGRLKYIESFRLLARHLPDPEVEKEAGGPMLAMAADLAEQGYAAEIKQALERMATTCKADDLRQKAVAAAATIR
jgi:HEAT repeat protein